MNYGELLSRTWNTIWEHKFLILLGVLVALGSGTGGASTGGNATFNQPSGDGFRIPEMPQMPEMPDPRAIGPVVTVVAIIAIIGALVVALALWVVSTIARGGLIAGASAVDAGEPTGFGQAWSAAWRKGWRLLGIGLLPAIPTFLLVIIGLVFSAAAGGFAYLAGEDVVGLPFAGVGVIVASLACILGPLALILGLLRTFANRACMLENLGVFASYRRGLNVLVENFGPAVVLFLIQIGIGLAIAVVGFLPGMLAALCCLLWPLLLLVQGAIATYFSAMWTLAWRGWTGLRSEPEGTLTAEVA